MVEPLAATRISPPFPDKKLMGRVIEWDDITPDLIREWAYDTEALLLDQDEDLLLYDASLVPTLLSLVQDAGCPKRTYIFYALVQFTRELVTRGRGPGQSKLYELVQQHRPPSPGLAADWHMYAQRLLDHLDPLSPVDRAHARIIARDLLLGAAGRQGRIVESIDESTNRMTFVRNTSVTETVEISLDTGVFTYTPWYSEANPVDLPTPKRFWWFWKW